MTPRQHGSTYFQHMFELGPGDEPLEHPDYLSSQLITYLGNKRALLPQLQAAIMTARARLGGRKLRSLDMFAGSGFVSRLLKQHSSLVIANDCEFFARVVNECYITNRCDAPLDTVREVVDSLNEAADAGADVHGFISELYAPADDMDIQPGERVFYTQDNARRLDFFAQTIKHLPNKLRISISGPLLSEASVHANTSGVFKGFYKDRNTGIGKFGGTAGDALRRIVAPIRLEVPSLSRFETDTAVYQCDANDLVARLPEIDLAYIDPPYNQHPYGSNYFMLNLLCSYTRPEQISMVSGIPYDWHRSRYNVRRMSFTLLRELFTNLPARFLLISFNDEGFIPIAALTAELHRHGSIDEVIVPYNAFRGSRNLRQRSAHVKEHLFLVDRGE